MEERINEFWSTIVANEAIALPSWASIPFQHDTLSINWVLEASDLGTPPLRIPIEKPTILFGVPKEGFSDESESCKEYIALTETKGIFAEFHTALLLDMSSLGSRKPSFHVLDLGAISGTSLNGTKMSTGQSVALMAGDKFSVGESSMTFRLARGMAERKGGVKVHMTSPVIENTEDGTSTNGVITVHGDTELMMPRSPVKPVSPTRSFQLRAPLPPTEVKDKLAVSKRVLNGKITGMIKDGSIEPLESVSTKGKMGQTVEDGELATPVEDAPSLSKQRSPLKERENNHHHAQREQRKSPDRRGRERSREHTSITSPREKTSPAPRRGRSRDRSRGRNERRRRSRSLDRRRRDDDRSRMHDREGDRRDGGRKRSRSRSRSRRRSSTRRDNGDNRRDRGSRGARSRTPSLPASSPSFGRSDKRREDNTSRSAERKSPRPGEGVIVVEGVLNMHEAVRQYNLNCVNNGERLRREREERERLALEVLEKKKMMIEEGEEFAEYTVNSEDLPQALNDEEKSCQENAPSSAEHVEKDD